MASTSESKQRKELIASSATAFVPLEKGVISSLETTSFKRTRQNPLFSVTEDLVNTYKICNPKFRGLEVLPQRILTVPSEGVLNNGLDNEDANLICKVNDTFKMDGYVFTVLDLLGTGTFGQVFRCIRSDTKDIVAVKVVKNKPAYQAQGLLEVKVARLLNEVHDPHDERHIVRLLDSFNHHGHVCLVFELLSLSLLDVLTQNQFRGLPLVVVQRFTKQILTALVALEEADVIHCDLKPENILLVPSATPTPSSATSSPSKSKPMETTEDPNSFRESAEQGADPSSPSKATSNTGAATAAKSSAKLSDVKVIDFGSACFEGKTVYSYIQSRFYRSPEVLLGLPYNGAIDMWSLACVCAEMFLGLPLFPGVSQHNQLYRIVEMLGLPPDFLIEGKNGRKYFTVVEKPATQDAPGEIGKSPQSVTVGSAGLTANPTTTAPATSSSSSSATASSSGAESGEPNTPKYRIKSAEEYAAETNTAVPVLRKYLRYNRLDEVIMRCPLAQKSRMTQEQKTIETIRRHCFLDFLQGLFRLNPFERWTARQAFSHPFIQNTKFSGPYVPPLDMKINERKLDFMVLTQRKPPPSSFEAPTLTGVKAPSNFSSGSSQFTPLLLAHRRMSDPGLDHSAKGILQGTGPQLLKRGSPAHLKVTADTPASPPSPAGSSVTESAVPFASPHAPSADASAASSSAATTSEPQLSPEKPPMLARARSGSGGGDQDGFVQAPRPPHSAAQGIMRVNSKGNFQQMSMVPPPPAHSSPQSSPQMQSQSLYSSGGSSQVQTQRFMQQHQQQILQQQQQAYLKHRGNAHRNAQQSQQQQQQGFLSPPHQQHAQLNSFTGSNPPHPGHYPVGASLPYSNTNINPHQQTGLYAQQTGQMGGMASSLSMHMLPGVNGMNSLPGTSLGNSYSSYGAVGSMQDGSSVIMTDFGLALMRPDMDENRRLQSQQAPAMHPVYWQQVQQMHLQQQQQQQQHQMQQAGGAMYGSPVAHSSPFAYINQFATQEQNANQHPHPPQQQQHASSYAYAPTMAHLAANYANSAYAHPSQQPPQQQQPWPPQQAGSYDSKTTMAWRQSNQNPHHGHGHANAHESVPVLKHSNNSQRNSGESGQTKGLAGSPQQRFFKTDSTDGSVNHNNLRRLNTRHTVKDDHRGRGSNQSSPHAVSTAGHHHHPDIRRPSPAYHKDERGIHAGATTSSGMIKINTDLKVRVETPQSSVVAESFVDTPNRTSFHMLRKRDGNQGQQGSSFIEREMDRRDSFILPSGAPHGHHGHHGHHGASINSSYSNSSANSSASSRQSSRQNSADSNSSTTGRSAAAARLFANYGEQQMASAEGAPTINMRVAGFTHSQAAPVREDKPAQQGSGSPRGQGRRRDPSDPRSNVDNGTGEDVLEEWDPFFEADDLSNNA